MCLSENSHQVLKTLVWEKESKKKKQKKPHNFILIPYRNYYFCSDILSYIKGIKINLFSFYLF